MHGGDQWEYWCICCLPNKSPGMIGLFIADYLEDTVTGSRDSNAAV